jgi:hypothetical protein
MGLDSRLLWTGQLLQRGINDHTATAHLDHLDLAGFHQLPELSVADVDDFARSRRGNEQRLVGDRNLTNSTGSIEHARINGDV